MSSCRKGVRHALLGASALAGLFAPVLTAPARAETSALQFDIPANDLGAALRAYGAASKQQIVFTESVVRGHASAPIKGAYTADAALNRLLANTNLVARRTPSGVIVIAEAAAKSPQQRERPVTLRPSTLVAPAETVSGSAIEGLVVTAQKRRENIQDVPIAISAFTQDKLEVSQIAGGPDLITQVPNMTFTKTNFSGYSIQIRGIGTQAISATTDPAVSVSHNNTSYIRNRFFEQEFYDLERVEVLRGPQGTLYGRNATAGVVNLITAKPSFEWETKLSTDIGNFSSRRFEGMANIPLVADKAALRIAGASTNRDGYALNQITGKAIDGRDIWSTRLSLRVAPTEALNVNLVWEHFTEDDDRLRSGKQLCKKDVVTDVGGIPVTNFYDIRTAGGQGAVFAGVQATLSQGCTRNSLYAKDSFQRPNGLMLPYYGPLAAIGLPTAHNDPYVPATDSTDPLVISAINDQSEDLRVIESTVDPKYRAKSDLVELQIGFDVTDSLTLTSETAYSIDTVYSLQDFNRFNTAPGAWSTTSPSALKLIERGVLDQNGVFCDPQLGCSDRLVAVDVSTADSRTFSQEFRLASNFDGPFNFSVGANYLRYDTEDKYYVFINSLSLKAAGAAAGSDTYVHQPYVAGQTDNMECMANGYLPGDPNSVYPVTGCVYLDPNPIEHVNDEGHNYFLSRNPYKLISYAAFGEAYWNINDQLKLTAGLRYTVDSKEAPRIPTWILASNSVGYPVAEVIEQEWKEPTGRLALDWKPDLAFTDDTLIYASYSHGYKAGGANPPGFVRVFYSDQAVAQGQSDASATRPKTFDPEFVDAFEIGTKNMFADGAVTLNLAGFYYDYKDYQISEIVDRSAFNRNFDATVWGLELEADWMVAENFRLGFKGGYESTSIADGEKAIDLMDRTAGKDGWLVVRPFPTYASSCVLPTYVFVRNGDIQPVGGVGGGGAGGCEIAYSQGLDPVTQAPYGDVSIPGYQGFNPFDESQGHNGGEGFYKDISGNDLPNAPNFTATLTADYTLPLTEDDWSLTLHGDFYWQSDSYWRVFNDHEYNRLDEYHTINLAAILRSAGGWSVMAYVKNATDETAITGAFLNSDDTGLTTNVFLTEPRLYGVRASKTWEGLPFWLPPAGSSKPHVPGTPYPFTLELGAQLQKADAPNTPVKTSYSDAFTGPIGIYNDAQDEDFDWGDGRDIKLTYQPDGGPWTFSGAARYGRNKGENRQSATQGTDPVCLFGGPFEPMCALYANDPKYQKWTQFSQLNNVDAMVGDKEEHKFVEFAVGREVNIGGLSRSSFSAGLRYAEFESETSARLRGVPDWVVPEGALQGLFDGPRITHTLYNGYTNAHREFSGEGPYAAWEAGQKMMDWGGFGHLDVDWALEGGVLFGDQEVSIAGVGEGFYTESSAGQVILAGQVTPPLPEPVAVAPISIHRKSDATVPTLGGSLGLSYNLERVRIGAGYRWDKFNDVLDGGFDTKQKVDRTVDGPYVKVAIGFGG